VERGELLIQVGGAGGEVWAGKVNFRAPPPSIHSRCLSHISDPRPPRGFFLELDNTHIRICISVDYWRYAWPRHQ